MLVHDVQRVILGMSVCTAHTVPALALTSKAMYTRLREVVVPLAQRSAWRMLPMVAALDSPSYYAWALATLAPPKWRETMPMDVRTALFYEIGRHDAVALLLLLLGGGDNRCHLALTFGYLSSPLQPFTSLAVRKHVLARPLCTVTQPVFLTEVPRAHAKKRLVVALTGDSWEVGIAGGTPWWLHSASVNWFSLMAAPDDAVPRFEFLRDALDFNMGYKQLLVDSAGHVSPAALHWLYPRSINSLIVPAWESPAFWYNLAENADIMGALREVLSWRAIHRQSMCGVAYANMLWAGLRCANVTLTPTLFAFLCAPGNALPYVTWQYTSHYYNYLGRQAAAPLTASGGAVSVTALLAHTCEHAATWERDGIDMDMPFHAFLTGFLFSDTAPPSSDAEVAAALIGRLASPGSLAVKAIEAGSVAVVRALKARRWLYADDIYILDLARGKLDMLVDHATREDMTRRFNEIETCINM